MGVGGKLEIYATLKFMKRVAYMIDTRREDGRWYNLNLAQMYNGIKYTIDFDVGEGGTSKI